MRKAGHVSRCEVSEARAKRCQLSPVTVVRSRRMRGGGASRAYVYRTCRRAWSAALELVSMTATTKLLDLPSTTRMCGLTLTIASSSTSSQLGLETVTRLLSEQRFVDATRGPDSQGSYVRRVSTGSSEAVVTLSCGVLALRGSRTAQPLIGERGAFAWNGQVFGGVDVAQDENDAYVLFSKLEKGESIEAVLQRVQGPWVNTILGTR